MWLLVWIVASIDESRMSDGAGETSHIVRVDRRMSGKQSLLLLGATYAALEICSS